MKTYFNVFFLKRSFKTLIQTPLSNLLKTQTSQDPPKPRVRFSFQQSSQVMCTYIQVRKSIDCQTHADPIHVPPPRDTQ